VPAEADEHDRKRRRDEEGVEESSARRTDLPVAG